MYLFMPFYARFKFYTAYEYLERRFDLKTRLLGSGLFLLMRGSHVAIVIYAPSLILSLITGLPLAACVLIMGVCTTMYTTLGGMKAVIWTDVLQFSILIAGLLTVCWLSVAHIPGGVATESQQTDRKSTRLNSSHTVISYAVFCLKKKKCELNIPQETGRTEPRMAQAAERS